VRSSSTSERNSAAACALIARMRFFCARAAQAIVSAHAKTLLLLTAAAVSQSD
jgi:hypothetical protein